MMATKSDYCKDKEIKIATATNRNSNIELYRIITMLIIIAHHYVVNSGLITTISESGFTKSNSLFLLLFGWGGKTGINCFLLITGFYMCTSNITLKKFVKLLLEVEFYKLLFYCIFSLTGYTDFTLKSCLKSLLPFSSIDKNFVGCYLIFFLFIPFVNILISNMSKKQYCGLLLLSLSIMSILPTLSMTVTFNYVVWFIVVYLVGGFIRLYPCKWFDDKKISIIFTIIFLLLSWLSVIFGAVVADRYNKNIYYSFVSDSNKVLALLLAVSSFCLFKNIKMRYNRIINLVARSCFGVLLIHAISSTMRKWLWIDTLKNISFYESEYLVVHAVLSVVGIFSICTIIDYIRIELLEKHYMSLYDRFIKKWNN